jgi:hypothetical protein
MFLREINTGTWRQICKNLKYETVKFVMSPAGLEPEKHCAGEAQHVLCLLESQQEEIPVRV